MNIPFSKPSLGPEEEQAAVRVLKSGWLAAGPETEAFEREFADYVGVKYAIFTNSCTSALKMAYKWAKEQYAHEMGIYNDKCFSMSYPENTFCATYAAGEESGVDMNAYSPTEEVFVGEIHRINMHYGGVKDETPCLIEDSAHRIEPNDPLVGKIRCYSFYVTKNMTTGSGGMFVTNDKEIYERARLYWRDGLSTSTFDRQHGKIGYEVKAMAGGYDGNDLAAAIGRAQLKKLPTFNAKRAAIAGMYNRAFGQNWEGTHLYPLFVKDETQVWDLVNFLQNRGIACGYHYPGTGWLGVSLPIYPDLSNAEQDYIIAAVKEWQACL